MKDLTEELSILAELIRLARLYRRKTSDDVWIRVGWLRDDMTVFIYPEGKVGQSVSSAILTLRRLIYPKSEKPTAEEWYAAVKELVRPDNIGEMFSTAEKDVHALLDRHEAAEEEEAEHGE